MNTLRQKISKYQSFFFYKRWWRDMHIVHVFVWNLMIGHVFFSTNLTLPGNLLHPYYCHCRKPQQGNYRQLKKNNKYTCIKTQMTNNQIHKKLTTSMKQLRKILIKNFLSIVHKHTTSKCLFLLKLLSLMIVQVNWMSLHWVHTPTRETSMSQLIVCVCHSLCT